MVMRGIARIGLVFMCCIACGAIVKGQAADPAGLRIVRSPVDGRATLITAADGRTLRLPMAPAKGGRPTADDFVDAYGPLFGVRNRAQELTAQPSWTDAIGQTHTSYQQVKNGVPVFGGVLRFHQNTQGNLSAANGRFFPVPDALPTVPTITKEQAVALGKEAVAAPNAVVEHSDLVMVDPGWYGDPPAGVHLAYHIVITDLAAGVREAFFIDAHTGKVLDQWSLRHTARERVIVDDTTGMLVRAEGGPPTGDFDADAAYDYAGDTYDYLFRAFGRDSINNAGATLFATVHLQSPDCPNAFGGTGGTFYCDGIVTDDIVAHEFGHGLTAFTADLIYQNQPGQLNESFSDVIGEAVDLLNGDAAFAGPPGGTPWPAHGTGPGTDTPNNLRTACVASAFMTVNAPAGIAGDYAAQPAFFGPPLTAIGTTGDVVVAIPSLACLADGPFTNAGSMPGRVVIVDRGTCTFAEKVKKAQDAGAIAVIVVNNVSSGLPPMGGADPTITIPSVGISQADGDMIKLALLNDPVDVTLRDNATPEVRWLVGEDSTGFSGAIRDMWQPSCMGDPDSANHPFQTCSAADNGGVHSGSGVPNHAFAILVDGKTFNGHTVNAIGLFKAGAVWHRALTVYLTPTSDFADAYEAFNLAAADLVGEMILDPRDGSNYATFTLADAAEVDQALLAVELNTQGLCGANEILVPDPPVKCPSRNVLYFDDMESGVQGWTVSNTGPAGPPTPYDWVQDSGGLPDARPGTVWFADDPNIGNCNTVDESAVHALFSPVINLPAMVNSPALAFTHYIETEALYDGGNVKIRVNGGVWQLIPSSAFLHNPYNITLALSGNTNPMAGEAAWSGGASSSNNWGTSLVDLSGYVSGGETVQFRFDFGKDGCTGLTGWFVDDVELYDCPGFVDCNNNTVNDACDLDCGAAGCGAPCGGSADCNENLAPDECDIADESSPDQNSNGVPDECEPCPSLSAPQAPVPVTAKNRYLSINPGNAGQQSAIRIEFIDVPPPDQSWEGRTFWVGPPQEISENAGVIDPAGAPASPTFFASTLQCTPAYADWGAIGTVHVRHRALLPGASYEVRVIEQSCSTGVEANFSAPLMVPTSRWGDVVTDCQSIPCPGPDGTVGIVDVVAILDKFKNALGAVVKVRADIEPDTPDRLISISDVTLALDAFGAKPYPFSPGPDPCP